MKEANTFAADKNEVTGTGGVEIPRAEYGRQNELYRCAKCKVDIHSRVAKRKGDREVESTIIFPTGHLRLSHKPRLSRPFASPFLAYLSPAFSPTFPPRVISSRLIYWDITIARPYGERNAVFSTERASTDPVINSLWVKSISLKQSS